MNDDRIGNRCRQESFVCELVDGERRSSKAFTNTARGFKQLAAWLRNRKADRVHACLEATGGWSEEIAEFLVERGHLVSIVNPLQIKALGQSELCRTKTDKADAALIARFCMKMQSATWERPTAQERRLRQLVRRRSALVDMHTQETLRLGAPGAENVRNSIQASIAFLKAEVASLDRQIKDTLDGDEGLRSKRDLIESIRGVGPTTSATMLAEVWRIDKFPNARALSAFVGVCPQIRQSGRSSSSRMTRIGNRNAQRSLYMAPVSARRCNPIIQAFVARLQARGKKPMQIMVAVMHKLAILIFGVLKTGRPFDPAWGLT